MKYTYFARDTDMTPSLYASDSCLFWVRLYFSIQEAVLIQSWSTWQSCDDVEEDKFRESRRDMSTP